MHFYFCAEWGAKRFACVIFFSKLLQRRKDFISRVHITFDYYSTHTHTHGIYNAFIICAAKEIMAEDLLSTFIFVPKKKRKKFSYVIIKIKVYMVALR